MGLLPALQFLALLLVSLHHLLCLLLVPLLHLLFLRLLCLVSLLPGYSLVFLVLPLLKVLPILCLLIGELLLLLLILLIHLGVARVRRGVWLGARDFVGMRVRGARVLTARILGACRLVARRLTFLGARGRRRLRNSVIPLLLCWRVRLFSCASFLSCTDRSVYRTTFSCCNRTLMESAGLHGRRDRRPSPVARDAHFRVGTRFLHVLSLG